VLSACRSQTNSSRAETAIIVTDVVGDSATLTKNPKKATCVSRNTYDLLFAYGLGDKIDGAYKGTLNNPWVDALYPEVKDKYSCGYTESSETFLTKGIDLVFAAEKNIANNLKKLGDLIWDECLLGHKESLGFINGNWRLSISLGLFINCPNYRFQFMLGWLFFMFFPSNKQGRSLLQ